MGNPLNFSTDVSTLQTNTLGLGAAAGTYLNDPSAANERTLFLSLATEATNLAAVGSDLNQIIENSPTAQTIAKYAGITGLVVSVAAIANDVKNIQSKLNANQNISTADLLSLLGDSATLAISGTRVAAEAALIPEEAGIGAAAAGIGGAATIFGGSILSATGSLLSYSESLQDILANGTTITYANGLKGSWSDAGNDGNGNPTESTYQTFNQATGQLIGSVTVPYADKQALNSNGMLITANGQEEIVGADGSLTHVDGSGVASSENTGMQRVFTIAGGSYVQSAQDGEVDITGGPAGSQKVDFNGTTPTPLQASEVVDTSATEVGTQTNVGLRESGSGGDITAQTTSANGISGQVDNSFSSSGQLVQSSGSIDGLTVSGESAPLSITQDGSGGLTISVGSGSSSEYSAFLNGQQSGNDLSLDGTGISGSLAGYSGIGIVSLSGNSNIISISTGISFSVSGNTNQINAIDPVAVTVTGGTLGAGANTVTDSSSTVTVGQNSVVNVAGNGDQIAGSTNDQINITGTIDNITANNDIENMGSSSSNFTVHGSGNTVGDASGVTGGTIGFSNSGNTVTAAGATVYVGGANYTETISGANDIVNSGYTGDTFNIAGSGDTTELNNGTVDVSAPGLTVSVQGTTDNVTANNDTELMYLSSSNFTVYGTGNTVGDVSGTTGGIIGFGNSGNTVTAAGATVYVGGASYTETINGANDIVNSGYTGDTFNIGGNGDTAELNHGTVELSGSLSNVTIAGTSDTGAFGANDSISLSQGGNNFSLGAGDSIAASSSTFSIASNYNEVISGSNDHFTLGSGDSLQLGSGTGDVVTLGANETDYIYGNNETIDGGSGDHIIVYGSNDTVVDTGGYVTDHGNNDVTDGNDDVISRDGTGDTYSGSTDVFSGGTQTTIGGGTTGFSGYATGIPITMSTVSNFDLANDNTNGAAKAQAAFNETLDILSLPKTAANETGAIAFEGVKWTGKTITWSFAASAGTNGDPFSGYVPSSYQAVVAAAFQAWAKASGLTFVEVSDSASSDIRIGWGDFNTQTSALAGYTSFTQSNGVLQTGAEIRLEDPGQDALSGSGTNYAYAGTNLSLLQLLTHEIGHALGLAQNVDPNSIMNPILGTSNLTLDTTDIANIQALYPASGVTNVALGKSATSSGVSALSSAETFVQAMASFAPMSGSSTTLSTTTASSPQTVLVPPVTTSTPPSLAA